MSYAAAQLAVEVQLAAAFAQVALVTVDGGAPSSLDTGRTVDGGAPSSAPGANSLDGNAALLVQYPNGPKIKPDGSPYAEVFHIPARTFVDTIGQHGQDVTPYITQVDFYFKLETGSNAAIAAADALRLSFTAGQWLSNDGQAVLVRSCGPGPARRDGSYYKAIVTIEWEARVSR